MGAKTLYSVWFFAEDKYRDYHYPILVPYSTIKTVPTVVREVSVVQWKNPWLESQLCTHIY